MKLSGSCGILVNVGEEARHGTFSRICMDVGGGVLKKTLAINRQRQGNVHFIGQLNKQHDRVLISQPPERDVKAKPRYVALILWLNATCWLFNADVASKPTLLSVHVHYTRHYYYNTHNTGVVKDVL